MKIRTKLGVFIIIYILVWLSAMSGIFNNIAMKGYLILEENSFQANIGRLDFAFRELLKKNDAVLTDWAEWDDTYRYIHDPNEAYVKSNINANFMNDQDLDYLFMFSPEDELLYGGKYVDGQLIEVFPERIVEQIIHYKNMTSIMLHDGKPLVFSTLEVTTSNEDAPREGLLCFAFYLDRKQVKSIEEHLELDFKLVSTSEKYEGESERITVHDHGTYKTALFKYGYINDPHGIAMQFLHPLSITALGEKTMREVMLASLIAFFIISSILYVVVRRSIDRIKKLSQNVDRIAHDRDLSARLEVVANDEISYLTEDINLMLDRIEVMNKQLEEYASIDMMTGVYNRRVGFEKLTDLLEGFNEGEDELTICYIDINNLKVVNDTMGHKVGDDLIMTVSRTIQDYIQDQDIICRLGGDEFLVIFPDCDIEGAKNKIFRAEQELVLSQSREEKKYPISISKGFLSYDGSMSIQAFIEAADRFMYEDKKNRNRRSTDE